MQFPIDITFKMLGWRADLHVTDGTGRMIGFVQGSRIGNGKLAVYADECMGAPIYTLRADNPLECRFENAEGRKIGEYSVIPTAQGKFVIVDGEPRYQFETGSDWLDFIDRCIPSLPMVNGLSGLIVKPWTNVVSKQDRTVVLEVVKTRLMIDISYRLKACAEISGADQECLLLSAVYYSMLDLQFSMMRAQ